jgi:hypothetical protein
LYFQDLWQTRRAEDAETRHLDTVTLPDLQDAEYVNRSYDPGNGPPGADSEGGEAVPA